MSDERCVCFKTIVTAANQECGDSAYRNSVTPKDKTFKFELVEEYNGDALGETKLLEHGFHGGRKWFKGWDTTPEEQKVKLTAIANAVKQDNDYVTLIVGNPDKQAAEEALDKIIDRIVRRQRQKDMSLYKEYMNEEFKINFRSLVTRMVETPSLATIK